MEQSKIRSKKLLVYADDLKASNTPYVQRAPWVFQSNYYKDNYRWNEAEWWIYLHVLFST